MKRPYGDGFQGSRRHAFLSRLSAVRGTVGGWLRSARSSLEARFPVLERRRAVVTGTLVLFGLTLALGLGLAIDVVARLPDPRALSSLEQMPEATLVYDAFDRPAFTIFREQRIRVPVERVSRHLLDAVLVIEDGRFYQHGGIDLVRIAGATVANVSAGRIVEGGSTITQQLARKSFLSSERTFRRKLVEILTALWIEHDYEKEEILELYLNKIYFGSGYYGAETAARGYLGKPAAELNLSEAALLAGLIQAPERYSPKRFPERAIARRNVVLQVMLEANVIDERAYRQARGEPLSLNDSLEATESYGSYFKEELRQHLVGSFGWDAVYEQGLRVYSTIDPAMQRAAEEALEEGLREIEARESYRHPRRDAEGDAAQTTPSDAPDYLQGALIALDPHSGEVRALIGGRDFADSPFNRATQAHRQPGSAFKPILYAAAVDQGVTPITILDDLDQPVPSDEGPWLPVEGHDDVSSHTMRTALQMSSNRAAVRLMRLTGIDRIVDYAARFGLGPQPRVPSVALGSGSVTLDALTAAYAAFANGGTVPQPIYVRRVTDAGGGVLFEAPRVQPRPRAVKRSTAFVVAHLLRGVLDAGTGWTVRREGFRAPAAGKTGTTDDVKDAWFIGFTPELAAGVWIGFDRPRTIVPRAYGADLAAPVWARFMNEAVESERSGKWIEPPPDVVRVEICASSLAVARDACRRSNGDAAGGSGRGPTYTEYFVSGSEPVDRCAVHRSWLASVLAPFRSPNRSEQQPPEALPTDVEAERPSVPAVHDHIFGNCNGRLVADPDGVRYVTAHEDAFAIGFDEISSLVIDVEGRRVQISVRGGRHYNFHTAAGDREALIALDVALRAR